MEIIYLENNDFIKKIRKIFIKFYIEVIIIEILSYLCYIEINSKLSLVNNISNIVNKLN